MLLGSITVAHYNTMGSLPSLQQESRSFQSQKQKSFLDHFLVGRSILLCSSSHSLAEPDFSSLIKGFVGPWLMVQCISSLKLISVL